MPSDETKRNRLFLAVGAISLAAGSLFYSCVSREQSRKAVATQLELAQAYDELKALSKQSYGKVEDLKKRFKQEPYEEQLLQNRPLSKLIMGAPDYR